jgi:hypothetical protein
VPANDWESVSKQILKRAPTPELLALDARTTRSEKFFAPRRRAVEKIFRAPPCKTRPLAAQKKNSDQSRARPAA